MLTTPVVSTALLKEVRASASVGDGGRRRYSLTGHCRAVYDDETEGPFRDLGSLRAGYLGQPDIKNNFGLGKR